MSGVDHLGRAVRLTVTFCVFAVVATSVTPLDSLRTSKSNDDLNYNTGTFNSQPGERPLRVYKFGSVACDAGQKNCFGRWAWSINNQNYSAADANAISACEKGQGTLKCKAIGAHFFDCATMYMQKLDSTHNHACWAVGLGPTHDAAASDGQKRCSQQGCNDCKEKFNVCNNGSTPVPPTPPAPTPPPVPPTPPGPKPLTCSADSSCNVCEKCCKSYLKSPSDCADCVTAECSHICSADASCNVCTACCKSYLKHANDCTTCVKQECHSAAKTRDWLLR